MIWQDMILGGANMIFVYSLILQVNKGYKDKIGHINFQTALLTSAGLYAMSIAFFTLELYLTSSMAFSSGVLWTILLIQRVKYK